MNGGCYVLWACGWLLVLEGAGHNRSAPAKRAKMNLEKGLRTFKYRGISWHTFVVPSFAIPKFARS